ncbi:DUF998 domain-containing protein [Amycolatopsis endophytica]|uniref:DUF998 domain-containing protein n=1 Tax=Amycolatopsis endophytica TaxID=860233 RepID=A0A853B8Y5_9PSEU|nr:DUF998 domain-containing protein [Amycolatopsis endophytica]NYI91232.1 hypothetical protein [Amycolatopsis endophytica]
MTAANPAPSRAPRILALACLAALAVGAALVLLLQFLPPTDRISVLDRTISEYALSTNKWIFDIAVLLIAIGSAVLFAAHVLMRALPVRSAAVLLGALWTVSLLVIVAFPKTDWSVGPSLGGTVHRYSSVVGFVCLPVGLLLAARRIFPDSPRWRWAARVLAIVSLAWFGLILGAVGYMLAGGGPWWRTIPLGLVERLLAATELLALATLAVPLLRSNSGRVTQVT